MMARASSLTSLQPERARRFTRDNLSRIETHHRLGYVYSAIPQPLESRLHAATS